MIFHDNTTKKITTKNGTIPRYAKTQQILADILGMDRSVLSGQFLSLEGAPKKGKGGYNVKHCEQWIKTCQESRVQGDGSLKDEKLKKEIDILQIRIRELNKELISIEDHKSEVVTVCRILAGGCDELEALASAEFPDDPRMVEVAQKIVDRIRSGLIKKIEEHSEE